MQIIDTLTVNTTTGATTYTTPVQRRQAIAFAAQVSWAGTGLTTAVTIWASSVKQPVLTTDADWVQQTGATITGPTLGTTGTATATLANAALTWYRLKLVTSAGSGIVTTYTELERQGLGRSSSLDAGGTINGDVTVNGTLTMASGKQLLLPEGSATAPSLAFTAEPSTGISRALTALTLSKAGATVMSSGASLITSAVAHTFNGVVTSNSNTVLNSAFRVAMETVKTVDYALANEDATVVANIPAGGTITLQAAPGTSQRCAFLNLSVNPLTIARNGKTINGVAADKTLAQYASCEMLYDGTGWYVIGN